MCCEFPPEPGGCAQALLTQDPASALVGWRPLACGEVAAPRPLPRPQAAGLGVSVSEARPVFPPGVRVRGWRAEGPAARTCSEGTSGGASIYPQTRPLAESVLFLPFPLPSLVEPLPVPQAPRAGEGLCAVTCSLRPTPGGSDPDPTDTRSRCCAATCWRDGRWRGQPQGRQWSLPSALC